MYVAIYDENQNHLANIINANYELTQRVYDYDNFTATGVASENINDAHLAVVCDEDGNKKYVCFVDSITPQNNERTVKGLDLRNLLDTEILIDYTQPNSFNPALDAIFAKITGLVFQTPDATVNKIPVVCSIPNDPTDTTPIANLQGSYKIINAYEFLKIYLKYYEYNIDADYDLVNKRVVLTFIRQNKAVDVNLRDFDYSLTTTSNSTNKAVATLEFKPTDEQTVRPTTLATRYYYRDKNNNIVDSDQAGNIPNRIYPVRCKVFEKQYLAEAQLDAVLELANARYVDNIIIDANKIIDPIDLTKLPLYTKVNVYYDGTLYKTLPIGEIITRINANGENIQIRLGFKKILLTEIIKGGK